MVTVTAYGALAGGTALGDIDNLRADMDGATAGTSYDRAISAVLVVLVGAVGLYAIFA